MNTHTPQPSQQIIEVFAPNFVHFWSHGIVELENGHVAPLDLKALLRCPHSIGFRPVYSSAEALGEDYPDTEAMPLEMRPAHRVSGAAPMSLLIVTRPPPPAPDTPPADPQS